MSLSLVEGWTYPIEYALLAAGAATNLTGCTAEFVIRDRRGRTSTSTGASDIYDSTGGLVRWTPGSAADLLRAHSPYSVRIKVYDPTGAISFFPNSVEPERWTVSL
jgi:hypothetical protein